MLHRVKCHSEKYQWALKICQDEKRNMLTYSCKLYCHRYHTILNPITSLLWALKKIGLLQLKQNLYSFWNCAPNIVFATAASFTSCLKTLTE